MKTLNVEFSTEEELNKALMLTKDRTSGAADSKDAKTEKGFGWSKTDVPSTAEDRSKVKLYNVLKIINKILNVLYSSHRAGLESGTLAKRKTPREVTRGMIADVAEGHQSAKIAERLTSRQRSVAVSVLHQVILTKF